MRVRRVGCLAAVVLLILILIACGQVYRPVVIPCSSGGVPGCPVETNPTPSDFHTVFGMTTNSPTYPGTAMQIDVAGDSVIGETPSNDPSQPNLGLNPTHMAILPNDGRVFVASAGSVVSGGIDVVSSFTPQFQSTLASGLGNLITIGLPTGSQPVFLNTTQTTALYVANFGSNSVSTINTTSNVVANTTSVGIGISNPVSLAETPNAFKLYVANQGNNTVSSLNPADLSPNVVTGFTGVTPVWVVARGDSQKVYVLSQGDGQLWTIDVATDTVTSSLPVGAGANFIFYDTDLNRLYVTNPVTQTLYVFSATGGLSGGVVSDVPVQLAAISFTAGSTPCPGGCIPVSVTGLLDETRFYVASYQTATTCPDPNVTGPCVIPSVTVFDANSLAVKYPNAPTLHLLVGPLANSPLVAGQYAVPPVASCATAPLYPTLYSPTVTRFRMFTVASEDSTRLYVGSCDAGVIAVVNTTDSNTNNPGTPIAPDTVVADLPAATAATGSALQNPIFLLMGQ